MQVCHLLCIKIQPSKFIISSPRPQSGTAKLKLPACAKNSQPLHRGPNTCGIGKSSKSKCTLLMLVMQEQRSNLGAFYCEF